MKPDTLVGQNDMYSASRIGELTRDETSECSGTTLAVRHEKIRFSLIKQIERNHNKGAPVIFHF